MSDLGRMFLGANLMAISKEGTSDGAFRGWETRRGGAVAAPIVESRQRIGRMVEDASEEFKREIILHQQGKPSDYAGMARRDRESRAAGLGFVRDAVERLKRLEVAEADRATLAMMVDYAEREAPIISERDRGDRMWHEEFSAFLADAEGVAARAKEGPGGMEKGDVIYWQPRDERGRFSHGEAQDPAERKKLVESAAREAHRRVMDDMGRDTNRIVQDTASEFGLSWNDASEVFQMVDRMTRKERELEILRKATGALLSNARFEEEGR